MTKENIKKDIERFKKEREKILDVAYKELKNLKKIGSLIYQRVMKRNEFKVQIKDY